MSLVSELKKYYAAHRRDLPWRKTRDPYKILVSEVMLQQTQVERVIPKYEVFLKAFPDVSALARAPLSKVLLLWSGLGYNRRGKFLHEAAKMIMEDFKGKFPKAAAQIERLPGVGHYTARAVATFAYNVPDIFIETNIRTVFTHFYFPKKESVRDEELLPLIGQALEASHMEPRDFYAALMDYGTHLKLTGIKINKQSRHYTKQTKFEGSERQLRGAVMRELLKAPQTARALSKILKKDKEKTAQLLARLATEGFLKKKKGSKYLIAD